jgi:glutamine phosphoribosylpyrophosphate amidotransferase
MLKGLKPLLPQNLWIICLEHFRVHRFFERINSMCGIVGVVSNAPVNQLIYDALLLLQHRGQDAAGIVTQLDRKFFMHKAKGMVRDVFRTRNMRSLPGNCGLGRCATPRRATPSAKKRPSLFM